MLARITQLCCSQFSRLHSKKVVSSSPDPLQKPNLIFVHGFLGNGSLFRHIAQYSQTKKNFNSYLLDLPNHGKSYHTGEVSMFQMGEALAKWIKEKDFRQSITLLGHSLGGRTIYALTKLHPELQQKVERIIILDAAPHSYLNYQFHLNTEKLLKNLLTINLKGTRQQVEKQLEQKTPNQAWFQTLLTSINFDQQKWDFNVIELQQKYKNVIKFELDSTEWKGKIVVLKAQQSEFVTQRSIQLLHKLYPNVQIINVNCGHNIQMQKPLEVIKIINKK